VVRSKGVLASVEHFKLQRIYVFEPNCRFILGSNISITSSSLSQYIQHKFQGVLLFLDEDWCTRVFGFERHFIFQLKKVC